MEWKFGILFLFLFPELNLCIPPYFTIDPISAWISNFVSTYSPESKLLVAYGDFFGSEAGMSAQKIMWRDKLENLLASPELISTSGGLSNIQLKNDQKTFIRFRRPLKTVADVIQTIILILPNGIPSWKQEWILNMRLNHPLLHPLTLRNADKFLIVTKPMLVQTLYTVNFIWNLKYKLILTENNDQQEVTVRQFCHHCPTREIPFIYTLDDLISPSRKSQLAPMGLDTIPSLFPDFQLNYHGSVLRASSTDKMEGDLEFAVDPKTGKTYGKRGVFASAMYHLAEGLNFTADLYRSSAGASTGHKVANGSWVGSVGDVYSGDASFCMLCGMSYSRHSIVEICSPVTYEYIRFAIGPSEKLYTWQAIFWPFDGMLWLSLSLTTLLTILCSFCFLRWIGSDNDWGIMKISQYYGRIFVEQSDVLPVELPQSIRIIIGFWLLFALVGTTIYRAKMVTFMTFPVFEHAPDTYDELIHTEYQIEFHYFPNIAYNAFKSSTNPVIMEVFQKMLKQPDPIKCLQQTLETKSVCIMFTSVHEDLLSRNMSNRFGISPIKSSMQYAFMFTPGISSQKRAVFTANFRKILQTSLQMGLNEWWERSDAYYLLKQKNAWIKSIPPGGNRTGVFQYDTGESDDVLHLKHLKGAYTVWAAGLVVALISWLLELTMKTASRVSYEQRRKWRKKWEKPVTIIKITKGIKIQIDTA